MHKNNSQSQTTLLGSVFLQHRLTHHSTWPQEITSLHKKGFFLFSKCNFMLPKCFQSAAYSIWHVENVLLGTTNCSGNYLGGFIYRTADVIRVWFMNTYHAYCQQRGPRQVIGVQRSPLFISRHSHGDCCNIGYPFNTQISRIAGCACTGNVLPTTDFNGNRELTTQAYIMERASRTYRDACRDR